MEIPRSRSLTFREGDVCRFPGIICLSFHDSPLFKPLFSDFYAMFEDALIYGVGSSVSLLMEFCPFLVLGSVGFLYLVDFLLDIN